MTNDPLYHHLRELSWRRKLTPAEAAELQAWLAAHPEARENWEAEAGLNEALGRLPDAPVASNFTARVLQAVERETASERRRRQRKWRFAEWLRWLPRAAVAMVILGVGLISFQRVRSPHYRSLVQSVAAVSRVSSLPSPEILEDFDAIRVSNPTPAADEELLAVLK
jgi:anti-sigma factor RsiW